MKTNYLKLFAAGLMLTSLVACDNGSENGGSSDDPNGGNPSGGKDFLKESPFEIEAEQVTPIGFTLNIDANDYEDLYYVACINNEEFKENYVDDVETFVADFTTMLLGDQLQPTDFSAVNNVTIFQGNAVVDMQGRWSHVLNPGEDILTFVYGVNDYGEITTKVQSIVVTMEDQPEPIDATPTIESLEVGETSIKVKVTPEEGIEQYIVIAVLARETKEGGYYSEQANNPVTNPNGKDLWAFAAEDRLRTNNTNFQDVDNKDLFSGVQEVTITRSGLNNFIYPNEDYTVMAFGVDKYGFLASKVGHIDVTTPAPAQREMVFSVEFDEDKFKDDGFTFTVTPSLEKEWYYCNVCPKATIDALGGADAPREKIYNIFADYGVQWDLTYGVIERTYGTLELYTPYYVVLFCYNGGMTSEVTLVECKTGSYQGNGNPEEDKQ